MNLKKFISVWSALVFSGSVSYAQNSSYMGDFNAITGTDCSAYSSGVLVNNTTGGQANVGMGLEALHNNTSGDQNVAIGKWSIYSNTSGSFNTGLGWATLYSTQTTGGSTGEWNTALGHSSLFNNTTGDRNTACGYNAMGAVTTGNENTAVGDQALATETTGSRNTAVGQGADVGAAGSTNRTAIGYGAINNQADNTVWLGDVNTTGVYCTTGNFLASDGRFKKKITDSGVPGLDFINTLRPVQYYLDTKSFQEHITQSMPDSIRKKHLDNNFTQSSSILHTGFIAQEVESAAKKLNFNFDGVYVPNQKGGTYAVNYAIFVVPLVKAVQEQSQLINKLEEQVKVLTNQTNQNGSNNLQSVNSIGLNDIILASNQPNPFSTETQITYSGISKYNNVKLIVTDLTGQQKLIMDIDSKSDKSIIISATSLSAGIYYYSLICENQILATKSMVVTK